LLQYFRELSLIRLMADVLGGNMRFSTLIAAAAALFAASSAPAAQAGLINPTSTVNPFYEFPPDIVAPSQVFNTGAPGPFSLAAPIDPPIHTTEIFNVSANAGFFFTNTQVTIYNNADSLNGPGSPNPDTPPMAGDPGVPFCSDGVSTGSSCADSHQTFDFVFTNEDITKVAVDPSSSADFLPATFGSHMGLTLVSANEFTVDVTGDNPAYLDTLVIDVTTNGMTTVPEPSTWVLMLLGFAGLGFAGWRRTAAQAT
jgi:PEP-CTERM motif